MKDSDLKLEPKGLCADVKTSNWKKNPISWVLGLQCICSRSDDVLGKSMKVQRQWILKTHKSDSQLVWIQVIKSPYYNKISFHIHLLKNYPVSRKISTYTTKYFCVMYYDYFKSWNNAKKQVMLAESQSSLQSHFLSYYLRQLNPLRLGWNCFLSSKKENNNTHTTVVVLAVSGVCWQNIVHCTIKAYLHRPVWWFYKKILEI